jgi:hypothetical protein
MAVLSLLGILAWVPSLPRAERMIRPRALT